MHVAPALCMYIVHVCVCTDICIAHALLDVLGSKRSIYPHVYQQKREEVVEARITPRMDKSAV